MIIGYTPHHHSHLPYLKIFSKTLNKSYHTSIINKSLLIFHNILGEQSYDIMKHVFQQSELLDVLAEAVASDGQMMAQCLVKMGPKICYNIFRITPLPSDEIVRKLLRLISSSQVVVLLKFLYQISIQVPESSTKTQRDILYCLNQACISDPKYYDFALEFNIRSIIETLLSSDNLSPKEVAIDFIGKLMSKEDALTMKFYERFEDVHTMIDHNVIRQDMGDVCSRNYVRKVKLFKNALWTLSNIACCHSDIVDKLVTDHVFQSIINIAISLDHKY